MRRWLLRSAALAVVVALAVALWPLVPLVGMVRDDLVLERVVVAVALDWRDFGPTRAMRRLQVELDRGRIGPQVQDGDCGLRTLEDGTREVRCAWDVVIEHQLFDARWPIAFSSVARIGPDGALGP